MLANIISLDIVELVGKGMKSMMKNENEVEISASQKLLVTERSLLVDLKGLMPP